MLPQFELYRPDNLEEVCRLKAAGGVVVAGGTDVYVAMHGGKLRPQVLIDLKGIADLQETAYDQTTGLTLGALTTHRMIEEWDLIKEKYYALYEGCSQVGSVQIRQRGTVGGNICNGAPSADSVAPLLAFDATCLVVGEKGQRKVPLAKFYLGPKQTVLAEDEVLWKILVPPPAPGSGSAYLKYTRRRAMDLALLGVAVYLALDKGRIEEIRIAFATAAPTPMRAYQTEAELRGKDCQAISLAELGKMAAAEANPRSSWRASREFRLKLLEELVGRAFTIARQRAEGKNR